MALRLHSVSRDLGRAPGFTALVYGAFEYWVSRRQLGAVTLLLTRLAALACLAPAMRASRVDPMTTLRAK